jgi:DNA-binding XRE family transcriptional regulator
MSTERTPPIMTHDEMVAKWMQNPEFKTEYERIEREEMPMFDAILAARKAAGLTQAQVAERMGTKATAVTRLENALITGKPSPSLNTLRKYAAALGKKLEVRLT